MLSIKVTFENGNHLHTRINATPSEAKAYYIGRYFNFGDTEENPHDLMVKAIDVQEV